jgi:deoxyribodipyrimidine photolyase-like uncharacterized protein
MNLLRTPSKSGRSLSPSREPGRMSLFVFATLTRAARQLLPRFIRIRLAHFGARADEDTAMHSPYL